MAEVVGTVQVVKYDTTSVDWCGTFDPTFDCKGPLLWQSISIFDLIFGLDSMCGCYKGNIIH